MKRNIQKTIYGSATLAKVYCNKCQCRAFVIDGLKQCCLTELSNIPEKETIKREALGETERSIIPKKLIKELLLKQENKCIYCEHSFDKLFWDRTKSKFIKLIVNTDHFVCWNYSRDNSQGNIYISCHICNGIKHSKHFSDVISAKEFINERRKEKGY